MKKLSAEYTKRTIQAIEETKIALKKAESYRADLQNHKLIAEYRAHIEKLEAMVA